MWGRRRLLIVVGAPRDVAPPPSGRTRRAPTGVRYFSRVGAWASAFTPGARLVPLAPFTQRAGCCLPAVAVRLPARVGVAASGQPLRHPLDALRERAGRVQGGDVPRGR